MIKTAAIKKNKNKGELRLFGLLLKQIWTFILLFFYFHNFLFFSEDLLLFSVI